MTNYKNHLLFGVVCWVAVCYVFNFLQHPLFAVSFAVVAVSSLFPDLDSQSSKINNFTELSLAGIILFVAGVLYFTKNNLLLPLLFACGALIFAMQLLRHRGVMHSPILGIFIASAIYFLFSHFLAAAFLVGFFSHLLADQHF